MSSNAFARSRPRVRHQRMPRVSSSCDHPRFLKLVNELDRINDLKTRKHEVDADSSGPSCSSSCSSSSSSSSSSGSGSSSTNINDGNTCFNSTSNQPTTNVICCNGQHTLNGYRSMDNNQQPASAQHDNYHHQFRHQSTGHHHQAQLSNHQPSNSSTLFESNSRLHQEHRCQSNSELQSTKYQPVGHPKQNLPAEQQQQQHGSSFSNNSSDLRQDENRSKRKRASLDLSPTSKQSTSCGSSSGSNKRHKPSSESVRPLSPSFTKCPICLLDCMDRDPSFTNTCFHLFCYVCIENWTKNKATCPLCRTKFSKIIFNIKSATVFDEKTVSPIRRDDDDAYITDPLMLEHLTGLNQNPAVSNRSVNNDGVQFLFENLRNTEVLMPPYFVNQMDPRQGESLHSFNTVTTTNFNSNVPHPQFAPTSYPLTPNYIALFPPSRIAPTANTAIASPYGASTSLASNLNNDSTSRRISRSGRYIYARNYDFPNNDGSARTSRGSSIATANIQSNLVEVRHQHHHQPHQHKQPPSHHHHHQQQQQQHHHHQQHHQLHGSQHRSATLDMTSRSSQNPQSQHAHIPISYPYTPNSYPRRSFNSPQVDQQFLDSLYRQMPEM